MKPSWIVICILSFLDFTGCSDDFELLNTGPAKPVVFCAVNPTDSFCYVTVSKSLPGKKDAIDLSGVGCDMPVDDAVITLEAWGYGYKLWETGFSLVDQEYFHPDNQGFRSVYKSDKFLCFADSTIYGLVGGWDYKYFRLVVEIQQLESLTYSRIPIIKGPRLFHPQTPTQFNLYGKDSLAHFRVKLDPDETRYASLKCCFYYKEFTDTWRDRSVEFIVKQDIAILDDNLSIRLYEEFLSKVAASFTEDTRVYVRKFDRMIFTLTAADCYFNDYFETYLNVAEHDVQVYSNFSNAYGLFTCIRTVVFPAAGFDRQTMDSLLFGRYTKHLRFRSW